MPARQAVQAAPQDWPTLVENVPAEHRAHDVAASAAEHRPRSHGAQESGRAAPRAVEKVPALQEVQADAEVAPSAEEYLPGAHRMQDPGELLMLSEPPQPARNWPAGHMIGIAGHDPAGLFSNAHIP